MTESKSPDSVNLSFERYDHASAARIRAVVERIYIDSYVDAIASGDPFDSVDAFMGRFDAYVRRDDFDLVIGFFAGEPVGQTWGWPLDEKAAKGWWAGLVEEPEPGFTEEDGTRTFALSEIMVRKQFSGRHMARSLHNELLSARGERRATLLVEPDNERAYRAYLGWGWRHVARLRPNWPDAPTFDVLMHDLPLLPEQRGD